jgi:diacylglycerol kinase (ATP)
VRICVIFNPTARGDRARRFRRQLEEIGGTCALKATTGAGSARPLACEAVEEGFDTIVAAGGDGTVNEVLNGIVQAPDGCERARLAVMPLGTVNVFAREYGVPLALRRAWETILRGRERRIDLPQITVGNGAEARRLCFIQMAGAGLDARAVELVDWSLKKRAGQFAYIAAGFRAFAGRLPLLECRAGGESATGQLALIGNGRFYGGALPVFDRASPEDGLLDVCVFPRVTWFTLFRYTAGYLCGRVFHPADMRYFQSERIELSSNERVPVEIEGELIGELPASITVRPRGVRIVVP